MPTRRTFLQTAAAAGTITVLPFASRAGGHSPNEFKTNAGLITVHPISHATMVLETPAGVIYVDPVGDASTYDGMPPADLVLVTHEHGDHYVPDAITAIKGDAAMITNPAVAGMLPESLKANASQIANGESTTWNGIEIEAIAAYNTSEDKQNFHPQGRDNGYILNFDGFRIYISGDTEQTPEMSALENIDLAFVCMNMPFTMSAEAAAEAVKAFAPTYVYPYHFRGRGEDGTQDPETFATLVGDASEVKIANWYG
ncbi:MBL fold metallo-hydrolase [Boseongicola aestuarii]|jgi:L-ascorbate metabolism protein UlaG (beta-lactamase superfamily)|uniref:Metal-dependent hydrolase n=1 Tax=Boseongicola aestuarii TaxID=1470561 RepID=A0A238IVW0_9RHOB|nr:MBL fold metallo-hydrolase [Boseongicola aestuarii]SMX22618.1 metal-dependent hydrolase [Boseongicola aestuarii]